LDACLTGKVSLDPDHALDLAFGGKALIKSFVAEISHLFGPRS
jgi:hypothetical protein